MLLAENHLGELDAALERLGVDAVREGQIPQRQLVAVLQAVSLLRVLLDQNAAGARIADVEHQVDRDRGQHILPRVGADDDLRQVCLLGDQREPVQIVRMVAVALDFLLDILVRQAEPQRRLIDEHLPDPLGDPGNLKKPAHFMGAIGELERGAGLNIGQRRRQIGKIFGIAEHVGVESERQPVGAAVDILAGTERDKAPTCPGCRPFGELPLSPGTQVWNGQPSILQKGDRLVHRDGVLRLDADAGVTGVDEPIRTGVVFETSERALAGLQAERARLFPAQIKGKAEVHELDAGPHDQRRPLGKFHQLSKHSQPWSLAYSLARSVARSVAGDSFGFIRINGSC